jgi:uncharacterized protein YcnI
MVKRKKKIGSKEDTTMKKNILSLAALLIASAAVFTACSSDDIISEQPANPTGKYTMTINASKGGDATTRALSLGRNDADTKNVLNATWDANEEVLVYQNGSQIGTLYSAASTTNETSLTGTLDSAPDAGQDLTLYFHTATDPATTDDAYDGQDGTLATIASTYDFCAPATITVGNFTVSGSTVSTTGSVSFGANQQAIVKFTLIDKANGTTPLSASQLVINDGTTDYTITPASNTSVIYAAIPGFTGQTVRLTAIVGNNTYTYEKTGVSFTNGQYYEITVKMAEVLKPDLLSGVFSVNSTKKVKFSKGNLRYESGAWSFFNKQDDYYTSYSEDAWDKFCWSTDATTYGMSTSTDNSTYSGNFKDWGETMGTGWRTLSSEEWTYLFNSRSASTVGGTSKGRYAKARVNNVYGVILFPDTYTHPDGVTAPTGVNAGNTGNKDWNGSNYTVEDWTKMESAGCVFLPTAGYRSGSTVNDVGNIGDYWSATHHSTANYASYYMNFTKGTLNTAGAGHRYYAYSVRLVRQVE